MKNVQSSPLPEIDQVLERINAKLEAIEDNMAWLIIADKRFRVGQRVEWSRKARKMGWPTRKKAQRGTVKAIDGFSIVVKLDNLKTKTSFHHAFCNPVSGPKLF